MLTEDEELVTNVLETIVNLAHLLDLRIFSSSKPSVLNMRYTVHTSYYVLYYSDLGSNIILL